MQNIFDHNSMLVLFFASATYCTHILAYYSCDLDTNKATELQVIFIFQADFFPQAANSQDVGIFQASHLRCIACKGCWGLKLYGQVAKKIYYSLVNIVMFLLPGTILIWDHSGKFIALKKCHVWDVGGETNCWLKPLESISLHKDEKIGS